MDSFNVNKPDPQSVTAPAEENFVIPAINEKVVVYKWQERTGTLRVRKVIHQVNEPVSAEGYREVIETTRVPVNQVMQAVEAPREERNKLVIPVCEERFIKQLMLLKEIHVTRQRVAFEYSTGASLRRQEVVVGAAQDERQVQTASTALSAAGAVDIDKRAAGWHQDGPSGGRGGGHTGGDPNRNHFGSGSQHGCGC